MISLWRRLCLVVVRDGEREKKKREEERYFSFHSDDYTGF